GTYRQACPRCAASSTGTSAVRSRCSPGRSHAHRPVPPDQRRLNIRGVDRWLLGDPVRVDLGDPRIDPANPGQRHHAALGGADGAVEADAQPLPGDAGRTRGHRPAVAAAVALLELLARQSTDRPDRIRPRRYSAQIGDDDTGLVAIVLTCRPAATAPGQSVPGQQLVLIGRDDLAVDLDLDDLPYRALERDR